MMVKQNGTMVTITQKCANCTDGFVWRSLPLLLGRYPAGNVMVSFAVLMAGASISKILLVFRHMGLAVFYIRTYFRHQRHFVFPSIFYYWKTYRKSLIDKVKG